MKIIERAPSFNSPVCLSDKCHPDEGLPYTVIHDTDLIFRNKFAVISGTLWQVAGVALPTRFQQWLSHHRTAQFAFYFLAIPAVSNIGAHSLPESFVGPLSTANLAYFAYNTVKNVIDSFAIDVPANAFG